MKLYYLFLSIFCIAYFGFQYLIALIFLYNLFNHAIERLPFYLENNPNSKTLNFLNTMFNKESKVGNVFRNYSNNFNNIYYNIISSYYVIPIINQYNKAEYYYLVFLDEVLLMFGNLAFRTVNKLMSARLNDNVKTIEVKNNNKLLIDSSSDEENNDFDIVNSNLSILKKIKKQNKIDSGKFDNMSLEDLNKMNSTLSSLTGTLGNILDEIKINDKKTI